MVRRRTRHNERWSEHGDALEVDVTAAHRTDHPVALFELSARVDECFAIRTRLSQECAGLRPFIGDRRALGIVLVIGGDQLGTIDDGGDDGLERCNLTRGPILFGLDDLEEALDVERAHADELDLAVPCAATDRPAHSLDPWSSSRSRSSDFRRASSSLGLVSAAHRSSTAPRRRASPVERTCPAR